MQKSKITQALKILEQLYSNMGCKLRYSTPYELLIATILSAQSTDNQVNKITEKLFIDYNTPERMIRLTQPELERYIKSIGFYHNKAKNILEATKMLIDDFNGEVPSSITDLVKLPGVGRKTANVVASNAFGADAIAVDTHVFRVSNRIGIATSQDVYNTELDLMKNIPQNLWSQSHHWLIWHGRNICKARKPKCEECPINLICEYNNKGIEI